ncbi:MAG: tetraacyldisaccharide 4'-kinase, partial [Gammaproteobacteria bacterium]
IQLIANKFYNLLDPSLNKEANYFSSFNKVHAVAGIGNNQKFFNLLNSLNIVTINHNFPDHYKFKSKDLNFKDNLPIIMTEKDAIKCIAFANSKFWQLKVDLQIEFEKKFQNNLLKYFK